MDNFLELPYGKRHIVIISPCKASEASATKVNWKKAIKKGIAMVDEQTSSTLKKLFGLSLIPLIATPLGPIITVGIVGRYLNKKFSGSKGKDAAAHFSTKGKGYRGVIAMNLHKATELLDLPPGHPLLDYSYVGHPLIHQRYIPCGSFHNVVFEEKANELMTLLASLGASRVKIIHQKGYTRSQQLGVGIDDPTTGKRFGFSKKKKNKKQRIVIHEEHYHPSDQKAIPKDLIWYDSEPSWQAIAKRRIEHNTAKFQVSLKYEEDYGINHNLQLGLSKIGIQLGSNIEQFEATEWTFEGEFHS